MMRKHQDGVRRAAGGEQYVTRHPGAWRALRALQRGCQLRLFACQQIVQRERADRRQRPGRLIVVREQYNLLYTALVDRRQVDPLPH